jgi:adenylate cyclase
MSADPRPQEPREPWRWNPLDSHWQRGLWITLGSALLASILWFGGVLDQWESRSWDLRSGWLARPAPSSDQLVLILLDQASLDWAQRESGLSWPWPREAYAVLTDFVGRASVRAFAIDVLFSEPSFYGVSDDERFAEALARQPTALAFFAQGQASQSVPPETWADVLREMPDLGASPSWPAASTLTLPIPELAASTMLGNVSAVPDPDGVYRRLRPLEHMDRRGVPSLGLAAYLRANPEAKLSIGASELRVDGRRIPLDQDGRALLRFRGPSGTYTAFSAAAILQSELRLQAGEAPMVAPEELDGRYVLFGFSAPGLLDLRPTPMGGVYPGVELLATFIDNLLQEDFARVVPDAVSLLLVFALSGLAALLLIRYPSARATTLISLPLLVAPVALALVAYEAGYWLPWVWLQSAVLIAVMLTLLLHYALEGRQKRFIRRAFQHYLSPGVIEQLVNQPERLRLGGERRTLTIFFSDLEGFTSLSERLSPDQLTDLLNDYLTAMTDIIQDEGGTVDKYEGDAIIAFWNAPLALEDHAIHGVRAAIRCQRKLDALRPGYQEWVGRPLYMRIGLHTGPAVVGNMGSRNRFDYSMLGDAVNLAARLEGVNKRFTSSTLISQDTQALLRGELPAREIGRVAVVGRKTPVTLFQPMPDDLDEGQLAHFALALEAFYGGRFGPALALFLALGERDPVAASYLHHCLQYMDQPPEAWEGVMILDSK